MIGSSLTNMRALIQTTHKRWLPSAAMSPIEQLAPKEESRVTYTIDFQADSWLCQGLMYKREVSEPFQTGQPFARVDMESDFDVSTPFIMAIDHLIAIVQRQCENIAEYNLRYPCFVNAFCWIVSMENPDVGDTEIIEMKNAIHTATQTFALKESR